MIVEPLAIHVSVQTTLNLPIQWAYPALASSSTIPELCEKIIKKRPLTYKQRCNGATCGMMLRPWETEPSLKLAPAFAVSLLGAVHMFLPACIFLCVILFWMWVSAIACCLLRVCVLVCDALVIEQHPSEHPLWNCFSLSTEDVFRCVSITCPSTDSYNSYVIVNSHSSCAWANRSASMKVSMSLGKSRTQELIVRVCAHAHNECIKVWSTVFDHHYANKHDLWRHVGVCLLRFA